MLTDSCGILASRKDSLASGEFQQNTTSLSLENESEAAIILSHLLSYLYIGSPPCVPTQTINVMSILNLPDGSPPPNFEKNLRMRL